MDHDEFYEQTDDQFEDEIFDPGHHLMTNEEIFTDEYMLAFAEKMDAQIAREKRNDKIISVGVIVGAVAFAAAVTALFFRNI